MNGSTSPLRLSLPPTSSSSVPTLPPVACSVVRSASVVPVLLVRVATDAVRKARRAVPPASSLLTSVVASAVAVVPLLRKVVSSPGLPRELMGVASVV